MTGFTGSSRIDDIGFFGGFGSPTSVPVGAYVCIFLISGRGRTNIKVWCGYACDKKCALPAHMSMPSCQVCSNLESPALPHSPNQEPYLEQQLITQFLTQALLVAHMPHRGARIFTAWTNVCINESLTKKLYLQTQHM